MKIMSSGESILSGAIRLFRYYKQLTEKAIEQLSDEQLHEKPNPGLNNIAVLMKHIAGNMKSRWTNFRTEDGEKPWRNRENEFEDDFTSIQELLDVWEDGWTTLFDAIDSIEEPELKYEIYIRNEKGTINDAIDRHLAHVAYHTGQIILIARMLAGGKWKSLSIPRGGTEEHNRKMFEGPKTTGFYNDRI